MSGIAAVEFVFLLLLLFVALFGILARKLSTPYPIVMVIGGLALTFIPGIPGISLDPDFIFLVVLPPLLYSAAWTTSWRDLRYNLASILFLAFGLVGFTVIGVAIAAPHVFPGLDWRLGLALGAIVAPTDAIAATSIARRVGLPSRIVDILEGESLINDATGLLALEFAIAIAVHGRVPTVSGGVTTFLWLTVAGTAIGLAVGWIVVRIEGWIDDGPIEFILSILTPYAAYLAANSVHASGVLAVVACGLFLSRRSAGFFSPAVRIQLWAVWGALTFVLNGLVFVLIGLQLPSIRASVRMYSMPTLLISGAVFSALLIALRLIWVFPGAAFARWMSKARGDKRKPKLARRDIFVIGWTGMRGGVSLAAALALPALSAPGMGLPQRDLLIFLTFCVIFVTLVLQGITLPAVIRALGLAGAAGPNCEEKEARRIVTEAAVTHLERAKEHDIKEFAGVYEDLVEHYHHRLDALQQGAGNDDSPTNHTRHIQLSLEALRVERAAAIQLRDEGRINDEVLRRLERELDLSESRLASVDE